MQIIINGLLQGILIGTMGIAFAMVYRAAKVFHVALGGLYSLAPYIFLAFQLFDIPILVRIAASCAIVVFIGVMLEKLIHRPLAKKGAPTAVNLMASLGVYLILIQVIAILWGNGSHTLRKGADQVLEFSGVSIAHTQILGPALILIVVTALFIWLKKANRGLELRALADNSILIEILGRNVSLLRLWVFGLSAILAALVSLAVAWDVGFDPHSGLDMVLLGMVAMIIGGDGRFIAPLVGGILLGILRAEVIWFGSARWAEAATFVVLVFFLFFRPQGIFTRKTRVESAI